VTGFMHDVATASLPVAIGLLALAVTARAVVWAGIDHAPAQRLAQQYVEPLSTWCLVAVAVDVVAVGAAGDAGVVSLALPLALGVAAVLVRPAGEQEEPAAAARPAPAPVPVTPAPVATGPPTPAPAASLWADDADDESARRVGLWSRA
jgi:hypothetical protein